MHMLDRGSCQFAGLFCSLRPICACVVSHQPAVVSAMNLLGRAAGRPPWAFFVCRCWRSWRWQLALGRCQRMGPSTILVLATGYRPFLKDPTPLLGTPSPATSTASRTLATDMAPQYRNLLVAQVCQGVRAPGLKLGELTVTITKSRVHGT
jgi:hypothetical protein